MVENITLKNMVTSATLELDKVTTPNFILESVDWGQVLSNHHTSKFVNQIGVYVVGTTLETRDIEIVGWVIARTETQMTGRKNSLNGFVNPQQPIKLMYKAYEIEFLPNRSIQYSATIEENNEVMCKFKITGFAPDPLFHEDFSIIDPVSTVGMFHFPLILNNTDQDPPQAVFGLRQPSLIIDVFNSGTVEIGMEIIFLAKGTVVNPKLININTQEFMLINKTLTADEKVIINTTIGEKSIVGYLNGTESNYFKYRDLDSTWLQLGLKDNLFRYDAEEGIDNLEVYIKHYNKYLEVQECY